MNNNDIKPRVKKVIASILEIDESTIADNANFVFDLGASSMQSLQLVAGFEEEFSIEMDESRSLEIQDVAGAVDYIKTYL